MDCPDYQMFKTGRQGDTLKVAYTLGPQLQLRLAPRTLGTEAEAVSTILKSYSTKKSHYFLSL